MANIVNGGVILLMAAFGLAAIVGGADELRKMAGPSSEPTASGDGAVPSEDDPGGAQTGMLPVKHRLAADGDGDRDGNGGDDRPHDSKGKKDADKEKKDRDDDRDEDEGDEEEEEDDEGD